MPPGADDAVGKLTLDENISLAFGHVGTEQQGNLAMAGRGRGRLAT